MRPAAPIPATNTPASIATAASTSIPPTAQPSATTQPDNAPLASATPSPAIPTGTPTTTSPPGARVTTPTPTAIATIAAPAAKLAGRHKRHERGRGRGGLAQLCRPRAGADCTDLAGYTLRAAAEARRYPGLAYTSIGAQWTVPAAPPAVTANMANGYTAARTFVGLGRRGVGIIRAGVSAEWRKGRLRYAFFAQYGGPNGTGGGPLALPDGPAVGRGQTVSVRLTYRGGSVVDVLVANRTTGRSRRYPRLAMPAADYARGAEAYVSFDEPYGYRPLSAPLRFARVRVMGAYHGGVVAGGLDGHGGLRDRMVGSGDTVVAQPGVVDARTDEFTVYNVAATTG